MHQLFGLALSETGLESVRKVSGRLYGGDISEKEQSPSDLRIVIRATLTFRDMPLHANKLDTGKGIVYERKVLITKLATIHGDRLRVR